MLASTPTSDYLARRPTRRDPSISPSCRAAFVNRTPPRMPTYRASMPTFSPTSLKRRAMPVESLDEDDPFSSPARTPFMLAQHKDNPARRKSLFDADDDGLFLAPPSSVQSRSIFPPSSSPMPLRTPVKHTPTIFETPARPALSTKPTNSPFNTLNVATGTKRKPAPALFTTPDRKCMLTPLSTTSTTSGLGDDSGSAFGFDRLAPLPAPRFAVRTPQTKVETDQHLKSQADSMRRLKLGDRDQSAGEESGYDSGVDAAKKGKRLFVGNGPPSTVKSKKKTPGLALRIGKGVENDDEVVEAMSPGGHVNKRRARARPVSAELLGSVASTPAPANKIFPTPQLSAKKPSGSVAFPTYSTTRGRRTSASSSSSMEAGSPRPRTRLPSGSTARTRTQSQHQRMPLNRLTSQSSATLFFGPSIPQSEARSKKRSTDAMSVDPPPAFNIGRPQTATRHSYGGSSGSPWRSSGGSDEMDEADLFFSSPPDTSFSFSVTGCTPSPTKKQRIESVEKLQKKYRPRDSGIAFDDSDDDFFERAPTNSRGTDLLAMSAAHASGSLSSIQSESDVEALITPVAPGPESGWPGVGIVNLDDDHFTAPRAGSLGNEDAFILRMLTAGTKPSTATSGEPKRVPGTPVKKIKTSHLLERPWQSAVAHKIGFPEFDDLPNSRDGGKENKKKGKPRQSLPAAFPMLGGKTVDGRQRKIANVMSPGGDNDEDEEASPTMRKDGRYDGLGLGRPPVPPFPKTNDPKARTRWLMRRSSSGAFSSGSETATSRNATPTRLLAKDWHAPAAKGLGHLSPLTTSFPTTGSQPPSATSSSGTATTINSPTVEAVARHAPAVTSTLPRRGRGSNLTPSNASPRKVSPRKATAAASAQRTAHARAVVFPGSAIRGRMSIPSGEERPGRFEREFLEIDELGRGEFGRVMKVQYKQGSQEVFAVKKSKRFEGVKHRLRLREEVDLLKSLSQVAQRSGFGSSHPNVLGYIDSWEEDETLYIQTELCALGNFAHFLWEYGRAFPRLDEARVWKISAELSSGLSFIHDAGVIHLDLKPANIFVTSEGRFKIGDFGMASIWPRPALKDATNTGQRASFEREGDKLYLAPEVLQGKYSKAADIFSLGMTILETATNIVVPDQGEAWHRIRREDFAQVDLTDLSVELIELIKSMMRMDPTLRVDATLVCAHPVIMRARASMESARAELGPIFQTSALAGAPDGWLEGILGHTDEWDGDEDDEAMDLSL